MRYVLGICVILLAASRAFFVSPSGSDINPGTVSAPFATLSAAQAAMEGSSVRVTYLMAGTYNLSSSLILTSADSGQVWTGNPCDPPLSAILDGGGTLNPILRIEGASNVVFSDFKIQNGAFAGIQIDGGYNSPTTTYSTANNNFIYGLEIANITDVGNLSNSSCIMSFGDTPNLVIRNNYCHDAGGMGLKFATAAEAGHNFTGLIIESNIVSNVCQTLTDCGGIDTIDYNLSSSNIRIIHNYIYNTGGPSNNQAFGIYLDEGSSNELVRDNIVRGPIVGAAYNSSFILSAGKNNFITNNIFDTGCTAETGIGTFFYWSGVNPHTDMSNNVISNNINLYEFPGAIQTSGYATGYSYAFANVLPNNPTIATNTYYNSEGGGAPSTGNTINDASPITTDPQVSGINYGIAPGSSVSGPPMNFKSIQVDWGPSGSLPGAIPTPCT